MGSPVPGRSLVSSTFRNFRNGNGSCQSSSTCRFPMQATQREVARTSRKERSTPASLARIRTGRKVASSKKSSSDKFLTNSKNFSAIGIHCQGPVKRETPRWRLSGWTIEKGAKKKPSNMAGSGPDLAKAVWLEIPVIYKAM